MATVDSTPVLTSRPLSEPERKGRLCYKCRKNVCEEGCRVCNTCKKTRTVKLSEARKRDYDARKAQGMCVDCGTRLAERDRAVCKTCKENRAKVSRERYSELTASSRCPRCGTELPADSKRILCESCTVAHNSLLKRRRDKAREDGKCTQCLKRPPRAGQARCQDCYDYTNKWKEENRTYRRKGHKERNDKRAQNDEPTLANPQESGGNTHIETEPEGDETAADDPETDEMVVNALGASDDGIEVNDIVSGHGIDRMALDFIVN